MDEERANKPESLPCWTWEPHEAKYEELAEYVRQQNKIPSRSHPTLGKWIKDQRTAYRAWQAHLKGETEKYNFNTSKMDEERAGKLEAVRTGNGTYADNFKSCNSVSCRYIAILREE